MPSSNTLITLSSTLDLTGISETERSHNIVTETEITSPLQSPFTANIDRSYLFDTMTDFVPPQSQRFHTIESQLNHNFIELANLLFRDSYQKCYLDKSQFHEQETDPLVRRVHRNQIIQTVNISGNYWQYISHFPVKYHNWTDQLEFKFKSADGGNDESGDSLYTPRPPTGLVEIIDSRFDAIVDSNLPLLVDLYRLRNAGDLYVYPGGRRPTDLAFSEARFLVSKLPSLRIIPEISLVADGEVNFLWNDNDVYIDLGFYGTGEGSYYARDSDSREYFCDRFPVKEGLPCEVAVLVRRTP